MNEYELVQSQINRARGENNKTRVEFFFDKPIHVPRDTTPADRETFRLQLETALKNISRD